MTSSLMYSACGVYSASAGVRLKPNHTAILSPQDVPVFIRTPQTDVNSDPVTRPSGRHVSTPRVHSARHLRGAHTYVHAQDYSQKPTVFADWQELQTVRLHRLHFKPATTDWQPAEGWLLAGNTRFIYRPAGVCRAHYRCDIYNLKLILIASDIKGSRVKHFD